MKQDIPIPGKYIHATNGSNYLELKSDGSYVLFDGSATAMGSYQVHGTELTIIAAGSTSRAKIQDGVITDEEGDKWVSAATSPAKCPKCKRDVLETGKYCPHCGTVLAVPAKAAASDDGLASISWLPDALKKELPWELFEAIGWAVVLVVLLL